MPFFTPISALAGGALIGLSASLLLVWNGRVAGISGVVGGLVPPRKGEVAWRLAFLSGLLAGGFLLSHILPASVIPRSSGLSGGLVAAAGLLVGVGTQIGGGCTSGHGVCGLSRLSVRSLVAVVAFMTSGALATFFVRHVLPRLS